MAAAWMIEQCVHRRHRQLELDVIPVGLRSEAAARMVEEIVVRRYPRIHEARRAPTPVEVGEERLVSQRRVHRPLRNSLRCVIRRFSSSSIPTHISPEKRIGRLASSSHGGHFHPVDSIERRILQRRRRER